MALLDAQIIEILRNGGGLRIKTSGRPEETLITFAKNAGAGKARLVIEVDRALLPAKYVEIARNGQGMVEFVMDV